MKKYLVAIVFFLLMTIANLTALNREYKSECDEDNRYQNYYYPYCINHAPCGYPTWIATDLIPFIPSTGSKCKICTSRSSYLGYFDPDYRKYRSHLIHQLRYCQSNPQCQCYWPEYSSQAAKISDNAYLLFRDLIKKTALSELLDDEDTQKAFIENPGWFLSKHGLTIACIAQEFRFSNYYQVCKDIENYAISKFEEEELGKIKDKLESILEALYPKFFSLYATCYSQHPNDDIRKEIQLMKLLVNDLSGLDNISVVKDISVPAYYNNGFYDVSQFIIDNLETAHLPVELENKGISKKIPIKFFDELDSSIDSLNNESLESTINSLQTTLYPFSVESNILLEQGTLLNSLLLHKQAIEVLTRAIQYNSSNREAYIERAAAYFETKHINHALKDYEKAQKLVTPPFICASYQLRRPHYFPEDSTGFAKGLLKGVIQGGKESGKDFIPSIFSSFRGLLHGLWAFVLSPEEVSQDILNAAYSIGEYIREHSTMECLECVVPEIKDLSLTWHKVDDKARGQKIGYIIGKYGVEIFAPIGAVKGITKVKALKRANTVLTLESCAASHKNQSKILKESSKFAAIRRNIIQEAANTGKILVENANKKSHIMQPKHAWDKLVTITGSFEEDCKSVVKLLEDNKIFSTKYRDKTYNYPKSIRYDHQMVINGYEVKAIFNEKPNGEIFLNDAWVIIK